MMTSKVVNLTRGLHWRFRRAERAVQECACEWVEYGVSLRDLNIAECLAARAKQDKDSEPLAYAELPGLIYDGPTDYGLIRAAHQLCAQ